MELDVIIIGAGPIGLACGIEAEKNNFKYLIIEKGCLVNSIYNYPTNMVFFSTSERLEIGGVPFISHGPKPTRTEALEYFRRVKTSWNLKVNTYEDVEKISGEKNNFVIQTSKSKYSANNVIISTGFFDEPNYMHIPGEELPKVFHYYKEAHPFIDQKVLVIGGGNSAVDVALETYRRGSETTMALLKDKLEDNVKYWVKPDIENRIEEGSIAAYFNSKVTEIREKEVDVETPDGKLTLENDYVFAMTGFHPDFEFLKSAGVKFKKNGTNEPIFNEENYETNNEGIFLAGVVCSGKDTGKYFIENSIVHAQKIFEYLIKHRKPE